MPPHTRHTLAVRPLEAGDIAAVERLLDAAYGRPMAPSLRSRITAAPADWLVADEDGKVAGVVAAVRYGTVAYVGSMGVAPALQRRGIARALMTALLAQLDMTGVVTTLLDATDSGAPLYERFGFVDVDRTHVVRRDVAPPTTPREPPSATTPAPAFEAVDPQALARAAAIDLGVTGCDRSGLLRMLAREHGAWLAVRDDGYVLARGDVVGPLVAATATSAARLLADALGARPTVTRAFVPDGNADAHRVFAEHAFARARTLRHMQRGEPSPFRRTSIYAQASLAHG